MPPQISEVVAGVQCVRVVVSEHPLPVGEDLFEHGDGVIDTPRLTQPRSEVVAGAQCVRVVVAEHPLLVGEELFGHGDRVIKLSEFAKGAA